MSGVGAPGAAQAPPPAPALAAEDLTVSFDTRGGTLKAVDGVSWDVKPGETLGIVGESGSGKSVAVLAMLGLIPSPPGRVEKGRALLAGEDMLAMSAQRLLQVRGDRVSMVFQDPMTALNPVIRVGAQVAEPLRIHRGLDKRAAMDRAIELLALTGIPRAAERARDYPHEFSGGMRQRAMIAMALACEPDVLIADEPTTALDVTVQAQILELLASLRERTGAALVLITHDLGVVADVAERVVVMYAGRVVERAPARELFEEPRHPYTWGLMDSVPRLDVGCGAEAARGLLPIPGQPPSLVHVPSGCAFHPRCAHARGICRESVPEIAEVGPGHWASCHFAGEKDFRRARRPVDAGVPEATP